jgi:hypothetical protein
MEGGKPYFSVHDTALLPDLIFCVVVDVEFLEENLILVC